MFSHYHQQLQIFCSVEALGFDILVFVLAVDISFVVVVGCVAVHGFVFAFVDAVRDAFVEFVVAAVVVF